MASGARTDRGVDDVQRHRRHWRNATGAEIVLARLSQPTASGIVRRLTPQPYDSGESRKDQGISKQGNRRVRSLLLETAWFAQGTKGSVPNKRGRRIAIVAVARRLAIALWRYLKDGVIPEGVIMKIA
jgi:transposase